MKKLFLSLSVLIVAVCMSLTAFALEGDGTEETPFLITNQGELELVTDFPDCHFKLANDIALEGTWIPLCKQTSSGYFTGVLDGSGYTISNLLTDGSDGGLFKSNRGTISNLNIILADEGMTGSGPVAYYNYGTISNCIVRGNISGSFSYMGGICSYNSGGSILQCKFIGNMENSASNGNVGGICGYNANEGSCVKSCAVLGNLTGKSYIGGICGYNSRDIVDCYYIGTINSSSSYKGGVSGRSSGYYSSYGSSQNYYATITDCYAAVTFDSAGYGISGYGDSSNYLTVTTCYYDKTISGLTSTSYGTPKSTAALKMKQTYSTNWDFESTWGIDKNINNGYPYLLWEYPDVEKENPYTVNSIMFTDLEGNVLAEIPDENFYLEINVTKNDNSKNADSLIIALYDENGVLIDAKYMRGIYYQNQSMTFGTMINRADKKTGSIKAFVWNNIWGMIPLSNSMEISD